jgi:8-oxo-dGTP pyrophosphatase MutT (NUDIX family)
VDAAIRETLEEAGIAVRPHGILGFDHDWFARSGSMRLRFCFVATPEAQTSPKTVADEHSRGAAWKTLDEIRRLPLRHPEVITWIERHESGAPLLPCSAYEPAPGPR